MRAMILAAGLGSRLRPLTNTIPKPLLEVAGTPLIVWNLLLLRRAGIRDVIINLHHLGHLIEQRLGEGRQYGMRLAYSRESRLLGTGGGIKQAAWFFAGDPFLVVNGDTLLEADLGGLIDAHQRRRPAATLLVRADAQVERWGVLECRDGRVLRINGRGAPPMPSDERLERLMFAGVHVLEPEVLATLPEAEPSSIIDAYVQALEAGGQIAAHPFSGYWSDVGTPERYAQACLDAERGLIDLKGRAEGPGGEG